MSAFRSLCLYSSLVVCLTSLLAFAPQIAVKTVFEQLGLNREEAAEDVSSSLIGGYPYTRNMDLVRRIPLAARVTVVNEIAAFAKEHVKSQDFVAAYMEEREANKPLESDFIQEDTDEDQRKELQKYYQEALREWEAAYPKNHLVFIKRQLQAFLEATEAVDFDAALKKDPYSSKMKFVNPAYEEKPEEWKKAFRAGKEATTAARTFARQWMKELP